MKLYSFVFLPLALAGLLATDSCDVTPTAAPRSDSGVTKATVRVQTDSQGLTIEQKNIANRVLIDNKPGSIKHLYVISPYSGDVILYSTVQGKVTSGGKRLTPKTVVDTGGQYIQNSYGFGVDIGGRQVRTTEVLQDDGSYGDSSDYIFWFDVRGIYHQHLVTGGQIIHVSSEPLPIRKVIINVEAMAESGAK